MSLENILPFWGRGQNHKEDKLPQWEFQVQGSLPVPLPLPLCLSLREVYRLSVTWSLVSGWYLNHHLLNLVPAIPSSNLEL